MDDSGAIIFVLFVIAGVVVLLYIFSKENRRHNAYIGECREKYGNALKSGDKLSALAAGRSYYSALRNGILTQYDEQAISNDLASMKDKKEAV